MLCSISTAKSGSNWLDRLRSNKGFPTEDNLGLDHYLRSHSNPDPSDAPIATNASNSLNSNSEPTPSDANPVPDRAKISSENKDRDKDENGEWFGVMTNVLSELFNMGGPNRSSTFSGKKSSRKQTNPKFCVIPSPNNLPVEEAEIAPAKGTGVVRNDEHAQPAMASLNSDNNKSAETKNESRDDNIVECEVDVEEEKEKGEKELLGYSRSEVTVIDTSFGVWKFDKLVYRRKNVWKVRDKKGKSRVAGRKKKRKGNGSDGNLVASKKAKVCTPVLESDAKNSQESNRAHFHGQNPHCKREEVSNEILGNVCQAPKTRLPRKSQKEGSSVVGRFPTSKKSGANLRKGRPKDTNRQ